MKTLALLSCLSIFTLVSNSVVAKEPPAFAGQHHVNRALDNLNKAKEKAATDVPTALNHLNAAHGDLVFAKQNKGSYQDLAEALSAQSIQLLKAGKLEDALKKIDGAIELISKAAEHKEDTGGRKK